MRIGFNTLSENPKKATGSLDFFVQTTEGLQKWDTSNQYFIFGSHSNRRLFGRSMRGARFVLAGFSNERKILRLLSEQLLVPLRLATKQIQVFFSSSAGGAIPFLAPLKTKFVVAIYATQQFRLELKIGRLKTLYRNLMMSFSVRRADRIVVNSNACKRDVLGRFPWVESKCRVVYHGIDTSIFNPESGTDDERTLTRYGLRKGFALFLSTIWEYKNVHTLLEAFAMALPELKPTVDLVLVGRIDQPVYHQRLLSIVEKYGIQDRVKWIGRVELAALPVFYRAAGVYVQPSFYETFGKTVVEAFASGCPVIAANSAATPEIVGDSGILFDPKDTADLADAIKRVLSDENLRKSLSEKGLERKRLFSVENEVNALISVFNELQPQSL